MPITGLTSQEAEARARAGQANAVTWTTSRSFWRILLEHAGSPINVVLFVIAGVLLGLQLFGDAFLTGALVLGNVIVGVFQETRAKRQLDRIALLNRPRAPVIRDGVEREIAPEEIVLGDCIALLPGDQVLVDGRVVSAGGLGVDESLLTGESDVLPKQPGDDVLSGSYCIVGSGVYEATRVGAETAANVITARARAHRVPRTPLQREVGLVLWVMSLVVVFLSVFVARSLAATDSDSLVEEGVRAAAVIVALVPQGLAVMVTVSYAMAAVRMAGTGVLIQRMNAVESISHVNVLCLDKTGTLTTNRLTVEGVRPIDGTEDGLQELLGAFAASASFSNRTEDAIRAAFPATARVVADEVPFDSAWKWSGLTFRDGNSTGTYILGAPEIVSRATGRDDAIATMAQEWAGQGLRVLLLAATLEPVAFVREESQPRLPAGLAPLGLVILRDEMRPDASSVIKQFAQTGIDLKVISGDHPETVAALASQAGLPQPGEPVSGAELETMSDGDLDAAVRRGVIFGRVTPRVKERIVDALRREGRYVAMIGDGVNDVPALKAAQVAVAMRSGSGITRDIADMVLLNDAFSNLPRAFQEGQRIRKGMEAVSRVFLTRTLSLTLLIVAISLLNDPFPVTPRHTALISTLTVGIPSLLLAAWAKPARTGQLIVASGARFIVPAALSIAAAGLAVFESFYSVTDDLDLARSALTLTTIGCGVLVILFMEPPSRFWTGAEPLSEDRRPARMCAAMLALLVVSLLIPFLRHFYEVEIPDVRGWGVIALAVLAWTFLLRGLWRLDLPTQVRRLLGRAPAD